MTGQYAAYRHTAACEPSEHVHQPFANSPGTLSLSRQGVLVTSRQ